MAIERLAEYLERATNEAAFANVLGRRFDSAVMHDFYARKVRREYSLSSTDNINVPRSKLVDLAFELGPLVADYTSSMTGAIGNGLYELTGAAASPRLPSIEDYAKVLVLAAARVGPGRAATLFAEWVDGRPIRIWLRALLKGARTDGELSPKDGLYLETLPSNGDEFLRSLYVQIDEHDMRHEQYAQRAMLSLEHEVGPALYSPDDGSPEFPLRPEIRNPGLSSVSVDGLCRAMSVEMNGYVDWFRQWWDYGDTDAFFLNPGLSYGSRDITNSPASLVSEEQMERCLELDGLLGEFTKLDLAIARWRRSKRAATREDQLVELRIAMESVLLSDDKGAVGEKRHRLAIRGAWLLGETLDQRKAYFRSLRDAYDFASNVLHSASLKKQDEEKRASALNEAQDICRAAILRIAEDQAMPDWTDVILGKGFDRRT